MIESRAASFHLDVLEASKERPVLVDFWAPWCGPCRMLGPLLEKLEREYADRWKLVKVNTDQEQSLAAQYQVSGIPHCVLFSGGVPVDSFTGALPESRLRSFLDSHLPDENRDAMLALARTDPMRAVRQILDENRTGPDVEAILWGALPGLLDQPEVLSEVLPRLSESGTPHSGAVVALKDYMQRHKNAGAEGLAEAMAVLEGIFNEQKAAETLEGLLRRAEEDPERRQEYKADLVDCFRILGQNHPHVNEVRKQLARLLH